MKTRPRPSPADATARGAAAHALCRLLDPYVGGRPAEVDIQGLGPRDRALGVAIYRTSVQRRLTLACLLQANLRRRFDQLEPMLQAVLLSGAAQLVFMPGMPAHAVVDEAVGLACRALRRGAGDLANAVLRKTATLVARREADVPWAPGPDMIPWEDGRICLVDPLLPPIEPLDVHLAAATSHPQALVARWLGLFGAEKAIELLRHGLKRPPVILRIGPGTPAETPAKTPDIPDTEPHDETGFRLWRGDAGDLAALLRESPQVWVQDPAAARPVAAVAHLQVERIVDWCAGRGTKTRQLARDHPSARVLAMETDAGRREQLAAAVADCGNVDLLDPSEVSAWHGRCDLVLVDVPCSNSGVYARRHEARYRYGERSTTGLVGLQRRILGEAAGLLAPGGRLLYSTCSIDPHENEDQVAWANEHLGLKVALQQLTLPGGEGRSYHDGGFFALLEPVGAQS